MSLGETLGLVVGALRDAGIEHMIAGSVASTLYSDPRATQDVDMVIDPDTVTGLDEFVARLEPNRFYVGDHRGAIASRGMFNVIDTTNGWKIDLIVRHDRPFSRTEFDRRRRTLIEGVDVDVATAEDVVLSKLEWARLGASERQLRDVGAVITAVGAELDWAYLEFWSERLDVVDDLQRVRNAS